IPQPANHFAIHLRQRPGYSYPKPVTKVHIKEQMIHASPGYEQPHYDMHERIPGGAPYGYNAAAGYGPPGNCPPGYCPPGQAGPGMAQPGMAPGMAPAAAPPGYVPPAQQ